MSTADNANMLRPICESQRFARFLLVGGTAAVVNFGTCMMLSAAMPFEQAVAFAYLVGMSAAFMLTKLFVFHGSGRPVGQEYARFAAVNLLSLVQVWLISVGLARYALPVLGLPDGEALAHAIGLLSPAVFSYLGHKHFTFGASDMPN